MFSIIVAVSFVIKIYSNSVHSLPKNRSKLYFFSFLILATSNRKKSIFRTIGQKSCSETMSNMGNDTFCFNRYSLFLMLSKNMSSESSGKIFELLNDSLSDCCTFGPGEDYANGLVQNCMRLFSKDYVCAVISNKKGTLCSTYPVQLIIPLKEKNLGTKKPDNFDSEKLVELINQSKFARTRGRFPAPVLLFGGKFICRSSTLARAPEIYLNSYSSRYFAQPDSTVGASLLEKNEPILENGVAGSLEEGSVQFTALKESADEDCVDIKQHNVKPKQNSQSSPTKDASKSKEWLLDKMRNADIGLLNFLRTNVICDLMVENYKVKYGMNVTSSEKVDRQQRYKARFSLVSIPYPGCEFFADYTKNNYTGVGLKFDWSQQFVDAQLQVPDDMKNISEIEWNDYMSWDLVELTQNYLKFILNSIIQPNCSGMLLHCISGWDRTPLFVSLVRLSLWADGLIHQSLSVDEIVYLTLAYDWLLFNHQFTNRLDKREEIMHFCFDFLSHIASEEYSLLTHCPHTDGLSTVDGNNTGEEEMFHLESGDTDRVNLDNSKECDDSNYSQLENGIEDLTSGCSKDVPSPLKNGIRPYYQEISLSSHASSAKLEFEDIEECLNSLVDNISASDSKHSSSSRQLSLTEDSDEAAVLAVTNGSEWSAIAPTTHCQGSWKKKASFTLHGPAIPPSALSSSFETAKNTISQTTAAAHKHCNKHVNSCQASTIVGRSSSPIAIPRHIRTKSSSTDCLTKVKEGSNSPSTNASAAEPGSSWQMVPSGASFFDTTPSVVSGGPSSRKSSLNSSVNGSPEADTLKSKLAHRKERLRSARSSMIPAYCAAVHLRHQRQKQQAGPLSTIMGHLANLVTGS